MKTFKNREIYAAIERLYNKGGDTPQEIAEEIAETFSITVAAAQKFVDAFIKQEQI